MKNSKAKILSAALVVGSLFCKVLPVNFEDLEDPTAIFKDLGKQKVFNKQIQPMLVEVTLDGHGNVIQVIDIKPLSPEQIIQLAKEINQQEPADWNPSCDQAIDLLFAGTGKLLHSGFMMIFVTGKTVIPVVTDKSYQAIIAIKNYIATKYAQYWEEKHVNTQEHVLVN